MRNFFSSLGGLAFLYGGPLLILIAIVLGAAALLFRIRAPWFLLLIAICGCAGIVRVALLLDYFRGLSRM